MHESFSMRGSRQRISALYVLTSVSGLTCWAARCRIAKFDYLSSMYVSSRCLSIPLYVISASYWCGCRSLCMCRSLCVLASTSSIPIDNKKLAKTTLPGIWAIGWRPLSYACCSHESAKIYITLSKYVSPLSLYSFTLAVDAWSSVSNAVTGLLWWAANDYS